MKSAEEIIEETETLETERDPWLSLHQEIAEYVRPMKDQIQRESTVPNMQTETALFDSTAVMANQIMGNGCLTWMTPHDQPWFEFEPPEFQMRDDEAKGWFQFCTAIAREEIARSNFYSIIHEFYLDGGAFGTAPVYAEEGRKTLLNFRIWQPGEFSIAEDSELDVDKCHRRYELTVRQIMQEFEKEEIPQEVRDMANDVKRMNQRMEIVHAVFPRDPKDINPSQPMNPKSFPIESRHILVKYKKDLRISGYHEKPFAVRRYLKWGHSPWGWSPAWIALPDARQLNFLERNLDALTEVITYPRLLMPSEFEGNVDLSAGGITYFNPANPAAIPREWATAGRYDTGFERAERKRKAINDAYHVPMFQLFANLDRPQMTALEVAERSGEKLVMFTPTFARMTTEVFNPLLKRIFSILIRRQAFPPPPRSVIVQDRTGAYLPDPQITYSSKIALAIKQLENTGVMRTLDMFLPFLESRPELLDNFNTDLVFRDTARNNGVPSRFLRPEREVIQLRQQRAEEQARQQQIMEAGEMAKAAKNAGQVPPNSPIAGLLQNAA